MYRVVETMACWTPEMANPLAFLDARTDRMYMHPLYRATTEKFLLNTRSVPYPSEKQLLRAHKPLAKAEIPLCKFMADAWPRYTVHVWQILALLERGEDEAGLEGCGAGNFFFCDGYVILVQQKVGCAEWEILTYEAGNVLTFLTFSKFDRAFSRIG